VLDPDAPSVGMHAADTVLIPGPMYHSAPFGLAYQALGWGCHVVIMPRFDAAETLRLVAAHRAQWLYQVPTMMHRIWRLDAARASYDVSSLEMVCHIAAACPPWLKEKWIEWLGPDRLWEVYSGTEAIGATVIGGRDWLEHRGSVGRLAPGASVRILDEAGNDVPPGAIGEIYFRPAGGLGSTYHYLGAQPKARGEWKPSATSAASMPRAICTSRIAAPISSSAAARTSIRQRSKRLSTRSQVCSPVSQSVCRTKTSVSACTRLSRCVAMRLSMSTPCVTSSRSGW